MVLPPERKYSGSSTRKKVQWFVHWRNTNVTRQSPVAAVDTPVYVSGLFCLGVIEAKTVKEDLLKTDMMTGTPSTI